MKKEETIKQFYSGQDPVVFWSILSSLLFSASIFILWILKIGSIPMQLPLFYSILCCENQLVSPIQFTILPAIILLLTLLNLVLAMSLHPSQKLMRRIISVMNLAIAFLITFTAFRIIFIFI